MRMTSIDPLLRSKLRRALRCTLTLMRPRSLLFVLLAVLAVGLLAGCGGGGGDKADSSTDVDQLLQQTFSGKKDIKSGQLDLGLSVKSGAQDLSAKIGGPFESTGAGKLPKLDIHAGLRTGAQSFDVGVTSTGDRGFVSYAGTAYEVAAPVFQQFKAGYEQSAKQAGSKGSQSLASLGIDPRKWLTNARNAGEAKVGDTDTVAITGDVDVPKLLDDLNAALAKIRSLGGPSAQSLPDELTAKDKQQAVDAIKDLNVEIYTGAEDKIMRRLVVAMRLATANAQSSTVNFDLKLLDLNQGQEIKAPESPKPFKDLVSKLDALGLGGLGGGLGAAGSSGGSRGGAGEQNLDKYSKCIQDAAGDNDKIRKCADLLTP
jgi:hypothetical protein